MQKAAANELSSAAQEASLPHHIGQVIIIVIVVVIIIVIILIIVNVIIVIIIIILIIIVIVIIIPFLPKMTIYLSPHSS